MVHPELLLIFFAIAFVYASVGFGGGSSYIAILALYALPFKELRVTALICNIIVVTGGTLVFIRLKQIRWRKILPIAFASVPMAFMGATLKVGENTFYVILGISLLVAAVLLWVKTKPGTTEEARAEENNYVRGGLLGGGIGFLSGLVGIGGGIFLSPLLNLLKWDTARHIAATASFFILVNSVAGIAGQLTGSDHTLDWKRIAMLGAAVLAGGQLGSRVGAVKFNALLIRRITAVLVFYAGCEVLYKHLALFK